MMACEEVKATVERLARAVNDRVIPIVAGECFNASFALGMRLATNGIPCKLIEGTFSGESEFLEEVNDWRHFWLRVGEYIVDITASQFVGMPRVVIAKAKDCPQYKEIKTHYFDFERIALWVGFDIYEWSEVPKGFEWQPINLTSAQLVA